MKLKIEIPKCEMMNETTNPQKASHNIMELLQKKIVLDQTVVP